MANRRMLDGGVELGRTRYGSLLSQNRRLREESREVYDDREEKHSQLTHDFRGEPAPWLSMIRQLEQ